MEPRLLLSAVIHKATKPVVSTLGNVQHTVAINSVAVPTKVKRKGKTVAHLTYNGSSTIVGGFTPAQMQAAYLGTDFNFFGVTGDGTGETIAIVDAYDDPALVNSTASNFSTSDLAKFDASFGLPNPPSFTKYGVSSNTVSTNLPSTDPAGPYSQSGSLSWEVEESLDVEWAHAMAPQANIVLIEAGSANDKPLYSAVRAANALGVNVVSMSFGGDESDVGSNESNYNGYFNQSSGITYLASAGDTGAYGTGSEDTTIEPQYPAASPYVVAVGGTSLGISNNAYAAESTWGYGTNSGSQGGSGGGTSLVALSEPAYQTSVNTSGSRQYPDISLDANPNTGVPIYDSYDFGSSTPWVPGLIGGTSLASPLMAGLVAVADQGRALDGLTPLNSNGLSGGTDIHTLLYSLASNSTSYANDFHDITAGNATGPSGSPPNYSPETGYDLATGLGSPVAGNLVFDLTGISSTAAANLPGITSLYYKQDSSSSYTDVWVNSATPGIGTPTYKFADAAIGSLTYTGGNGTDTFTLNLSAGTMLESSALAINVFGSGSGSNVLTIIGANSGNTAYTVSSAYADFGTTTINFSNIATVNLNPTTGSNTLTVNSPDFGTDFTVGSSYVNYGGPIFNFSDIASVSLTPLAGTSTVTVNGNAIANDSFTVTSASIAFNSTTFSFTNASLLTLNPGKGTDSLAVNSGSVTIAQQSAGLGILTRNFSSISIASGGSALFSTAPLHTDRMLIGVSSLLISGQLDLGGNDMIVHGGNLTTLTNLLATGYANGSWNGQGIASTAANADTTHLTALGIIQNNLYGGSSQPQFDGSSPLPTDVLIKYTYYGDTDLSGKVDGTDYSRIDVGYLTSGTTWASGDFNYDKHVDGSDYTLIDNAFNTQGNPM